MGIATPIIHAIAKAMPTGNTDTRVADNISTAIEEVGTEPTECSLSNCEPWLRKPYVLVTLTSTPLPDADAATPMSMSMCAVVRECIQSCNWW